MPISFKLGLGAQQDSGPPEGMPLGIPAPPFGIDEVAPATPDPWNSEVAGFYYVNPQTGSDAYTYGYPAQPRQSIPTSPAAGSVIELHGTFSGDLSRTYTGTSGSPIYLRGVSQASMPILTGEWDISGSYIIMENLDVNFAGTIVGAITILSPADHVVLRHSDISGNLNGGSVAIITYDTNSSSYCVVYDCVIHDNGDVETQEDQDRHGIVVGDKQSYIWILDNELYRNSGDGLQINGDKTATNHIYIGRNVSHDNKQTGLWTKEASDVIFSENECYNHVPSPSSSGSGIGGQYDHDRVWIIFNYCHDNTIGISTGSASVSRSGMYFIGNLLINNDTGLEVNGGYTGEYALNNTFYNNGIHLANGYYPVTIRIANNIFAGQRTSDISFVEYGSGALSDLRNCLFLDPAIIIWDDVTYDVPGLQAVGEGQGCVEGTPDFVSGTDFNLQATSDAIGIGLVEAAYATFDTLYGLSIAKDRDGRDRPQGGSWDAGAYEYGS